MKGRKLVLTGVVALLVGALGLFGVGRAFAWGPFGGTVQGYGPGAVAGAPGWGGMMGGYGLGGMMGGWYGQGATSQGQPITLDQAIKNVQAYVDNTGNKDLAIDEVMEFQNNFYAIVKEKSTGTGAFELLVNKYTGGVFPEIGPNMMWNTKYGMHSGGAYGQGGYGMMGGYGRGMMGGWYGQNPQGSQGPQSQGPLAPTTPMTVTPEQAKAVAQKWLDQYQPGSSTEEPDQFYGYYTVHTLKDGKVSGMLSVNGYTGQVWYHSWHGAFVQLKELGK